MRTLTNDATTSHRGVHTGHGVITLPTITTVVKRQAGSRIQNINTAGAARGNPLEYSASALSRSVFQSSLGQLRLLEVKGG